MNMGCNLVPFGQLQRFVTVWGKMKHFGWLMALAGCATVAPDIPTPVTSPLGNDLPMPGTEALAPPTGMLLLEQARSLALRHSPALAALQWEVSARTALVDQAGAWPNPTFEANVEDVAIAGNGLDAEGLQLTAQVSQPLELGGEPGARRRRAERERDAAGWELELARLDVFAEVTKAFVELLAAQRRSEDAAAIRELAQGSVAAVEAKAEAGRVSGLELSRTRVALALAEIEAERAEHARDAARHRLAALWGDSEPSFERAVGAFPIPEELPALADMLESLEQSPMMAARRNAVATSEARLAEEEAAAIPRPIRPEPQSDRRPPSPPSGVLTSFGGICGKHPNKKTTGAFGSRAKAPRRKENQHLGNLCAFAS